ncbi:MAG: alpha/beta hydrolase-fold protein [Pseudomonadota bacterium]
MHAEFRKLFRKGPPRRGTVDRFVAKHTFPLVEDSNVTFVYRGHAQEVFLRRWIHGVSGAQPLQQMAGSDLWAVTMEVEADARFEYKFEVVNHGNRQLVLDALNPVLANDPFGANSVCQGYRYTRPEWSLEDAAARRGRYERLDIDSKAFGEHRRVDVYLPARYRETTRYPVLICHDGHDYLRYAALGTVLDNLVHRLEIDEVIVALTTSPNRLGEYAGDDRHAAFVGEELLPALTERYPLIDDARARGLMGASFGGVASLHAAWRNPGVFGRLLLQSGSFAFSDIGEHQRGPTFDPVVKFVNAFRKDPGTPAQRVYLSCGVYESLIYENRSMAPLLQRHGMQVMFEEARDAHNWENWRDRQRRALAYLFPGPLYFVYE